MRLSYTPISLLQFLLITVLTLFLKPDAHAQSMLATNYSHHHFGNDRALVEVSHNDSLESMPGKYNAEVLNEGNLSTVNFLHAQTPLLPTKNIKTVFTGYHPLPVRIYSASIQNSMRVTVKFFKLVIVPLWCTQRGIR